jgi:methylglutaconyl-CoA hydratase
MSLVLYESRDRVGYITLNRPDKRNALSDELIGELHRAFETAGADRSVKVVVLKANGEAFCAGADLAYLQKLQTYSFEQNLEDSNRLKELFLTIYTLSKVVIAQVQGHALAGGCGLASICDFTIASSNVKLGYTEVKIGFIPALVSVFLVRKIGEQRARHLLLSGELISAATAMEWGLIYQVTEPDRLEKEVHELAGRLVKGNSLQAMQLTKQLIHEGQLLSLHDALQLAARLNAHARATDDCKKGIAAFLNKQDLTW